VSGSDAPCQQLVRKFEGIKNISKFLIAIIFLVIGLAVAAIGAMTVGGGAMMGTGLSTGI